MGGKCEAHKSMIPYHLIPKVDKDDKPKKPEHDHKCSDSCKKHDHRCCGSEKKHAPPPKEHDEPKKKKDDDDKCCPGTLSENFEVRLLHHRRHQRPPSKPAQLTPPTQFPHLIIPIDSAQPKKSYATSFNGTASGTISTIFNFDIPATAAGKTCSLEFLFPKQSQLETSAFSLSGSGAVEFSVLKTAAHQGTTAATKPATHQSLGETKLAPGNAYKLWEGKCAAGQTVGVEMKAKGDTCLNYFQDFNPCPIGLYVNVE